MIGRQTAMSDAALYKQEARLFEQREEWERAIESYERAIEADAQVGSEVDLSLLNRVGDLHQRIGNVDKAVYYYEAAVDGHIGAGLYNNAIALCNKILRSMPNRHPIYLKLGTIDAAKGFLADARKHFLYYVERMQQADRLDEAFTALVEFADSSPDPEVRLMIADQLREHDRREQAAEQFRLAWRDLVSEGREKDAREVRERIIEIDPNRDPERNPPEEAMSTAVDVEGIIELPELEPLPLVWPSENGELAPVDIEPTSTAEWESAVALDGPEAPPEAEPLEIVPASLAPEEPAGTANGLTEATAELERVKAATLRALVRGMEAKARYLKGDAERVASLCERMATHLGLSPSEVEEIRNAGLLHDIGMINTRDAVLQKSGPLTEQEHEHLKNHVTVAAEILQPLTYLGRSVEYIRYHHERLDGSGYPEGRRGDEIPLGAQIVGVADAYSTLTEQHPFRPAVSPTEALQALRGAEGVWFDRRLLAALEWAVVEGTDEAATDDSEANREKNRARAMPAAPLPNPFDARVVA